MSTCARIVNIPGSRGQAGEDGSNGTDGKNSFTVTTDSFTMPAVGDTVTVTVEDTSWIVPSQNVGGAGEVDGQVIVVEFAGSFLATSVVDSTHVELYNLGYPNNTPPGTSIPSGAAVGVGGLMGEAGTAAGGALEAANNLSDLTNLAAAYSNLGLGSMAFLSNVADAQLTGVISIAHGGTNASDAATARTNLGLGTLAVQNSNAVAITGGTLTGMTLVSGTAGAFSALNATGDAAFTGRVFIGAAIVQTLLAASAVNPSSAVVRVSGSGGPVTLIATPTITPPADDGQYLIIKGGTNAVTFQDETSLAGTKLRLGAATRVLGNRDILVLLYDSTDEEWCEVAFTNNL